MAFAKPVAGQRLPFRTENARKKIGAQRRIRARAQLSDNDRDGSGQEEKKSDKSPNRE
jgi:hypothetical protein